MQKETTTPLQTLATSKNFSIQTLPKSFLRSLAGTILQQQAEEIWCIFDNTASGAALGDAQTLKDLLASDST
jgi:uncharacterized protein YecE (DUF72 family)